MLQAWASHPVLLWSFFKRIGREADVKAPLAMERFRVVYPGRCASLKGRDCLDLRSVL